MESEDEYRDCPSRHPRIVARQQAVRTAMERGVTRDQAVAQAFRSIPIPPSFTQQREATQVSTTYEELVTRMRTARDEMTRIADRGNDVNTSDIVRVKALSAEIETAQAELTQRMADSGQYATVSGVQSGCTEQPGGAYGNDDQVRRDRAKRIVDDAHRSGEVGDAGATRAESLLNHHRPSERRAAAKWVDIAGDPAYVRAFAALVKDPTRGHLLWSEQERAAYARAEEYRAMNLTDANGGYMVPFHLDPSIMLTNDGNVNPLRLISRNVTIASDTWHGVTSAGATAEWLAEATEAADGSPTLAQPSIPVHKLMCFVPYSYEVEGDAADILGELQRVLFDAADNKLAEAYMRGTGSGQPTGVITALGAGQKVATATADAIVASDVVGLQNALAARWQPRAQWCANLETINSLASLETGNGALRFPELANGRLLRKPMNEASHMNGPGDTASAGNDNVALYGDYQQFVIVSRVGTTVELIPNLVGANRRPTGQRGMHLWMRTGSDVVIDGAFRLLTA